MEEHWRNRFALLHSFAIALSDKLFLIVLNSITHLSFANKPCLADKSNPTINTKKNWFKKAPNTEILIHQNITFFHRYVYMYTSFFAGSARPVECERLAGGKVF